MMLTEDIFKNVMAASAPKGKSNKDKAEEITFEDI